MTDSYEIMNCVSEWLKSIEMKKFSNDGMFLQTKITFIICQNKNTSTTRTNGGSFPISRVLRHPTIEKSFWFQASVVYLGTIAPRSWRRTIRAYLYLQAPKMAVGTEFAFYMVELARFLVIFLKFRKSRRRQTKSWDWTGRPVIDSTLEKTSEDGFQELIQFILFQMYRLQLTAVYCNRQHLKWPVFAM